MIAISILGIKDDNDKIIEVDKLKTDYIHLDIADGLFVPNYVNLTDIPSLKTKLDVHLMVEDIVKYIDIYKELKPEYITFHIEATKYPLALIDYIHSLGIKVGIAINPKTQIITLLPYLKYIDLVVVMCVEPGFSGRPFLRENISKVKELQLIRKQKQYHYLIEVDGGVNINTIDQCLDADIQVVGSYITNSPNYKETLDILKEKIIRGS